MNAGSHRRLSPRAVIFNLAGGLVRVSPREYRDLIAEMARILTAPVFEFTDLWLRIMDERETAAAGTIEDDVNYVLRALGVFTHLDQVRNAVDLLYRYERRILQPGEDVIAVLSRIKESGVRTGVISNSGALVAGLWPQSPLASGVDAAVFSCEAGVRLPDPRIYALAARRLGVPSGECIYVGDGRSDDLSGAARAGMMPVQLTRADGSGVAPSQREAWQGATIRSLYELLDLIGSGRPHAAEPDEEEPAKPEV